VKTDPQQRVEVGDLRVGWYKMRKPLHGIAGAFNDLEGHLKFDLPAGGIELGFTGLIGFNVPFLLIR
jgi:hypothetical protein